MSFELSYLQNLGKNYIYSLEKIDLFSQIDLWNLKTDPNNFPEYAYLFFFILICYVSTSMHNYEELSGE